MVVNEEEAINITIQHGYDGSEFETMAWKRRGCLIPDRTLEGLISKLLTIYSGVKFEGKGKKRTYILKDKKVEVSERKFNYKGTVRDYEPLKVEEKHFNSNGVYIITLENKIYIGSTTAGFKSRFLQHYNNHSSTEEISNMLNNGGRFETLWISPDNNVSDIRSKEVEYIKKYKKLNIYTIINKYHNWNYNKAKYVNIKVCVNDLSKVLSLLKENNINTA